jgi:DHA1 family multidrug resistance protein-like MFS transporter
MDKPPESECRYPGNRVIWDGQDDPEHPHNWALWRKLSVVILLTLLTLVITIQSSIFGTGATAFDKEFGVSNEVGILGTTLFLLVSSPLLFFLATYKRAYIWRLCTEMAS